MSPDSIVLKIITSSCKDPRAKKSNNKMQVVHSTPMKYTDALEHRETKTESKAVKEVMTSAVLTLLVQATKK